VQIYDVGLQFRQALQKRTTTDYIILHHAAASEASVTSIHNWHLQRGWAGIGYHYYVRKDGSIYRGRSEDTIGAHTEEYNSRSIGICAEGNFEVEMMSDAQKRAIIELLRELKKRYPNAQIKRHKDFAATACPGKNYPFEEIVRETLKEEDEAMKKGDKGTQVKKIQEMLLALGYSLPKYGADGAFGSETEAAVNAFKKAVNLPQNGIVDINTLLAMSEALVNKEKARTQDFQNRLQVAKTYAKKIAEEV